MTSSLSKVSEESVDLVIDSFGLVGVVSDACGADDERARDLITRMIEQVINVHDFAQIDKSLPVRTPDAFMLMVRENMGDDVSDEEFQAVQLWYEATVIRGILDSVGMKMLPKYL